VGLPALLEDLSFVLEHSFPEGYVRLIHPEFILEFLVPEAGRRTSKPDNPYQLVYWEGTRCINRRYSLSSFVVDTPALLVDLGRAEFAAHGANFFPVPAGGLPDGTGPLRIQGYRVHGLPVQVAPGS